MDEQNRSRTGYQYHSEDRRPNVLPSISSRLHYTTNAISDASNSRQSPPESPNYAQSGALSHATYDPVHDAYNLPRVGSSQASGFQDAYTSEPYNRGDRGSLHTYGTPRRYEDMTLAPLQPGHGHAPHSPHSPMRGSEAQSFRPVRTYSPAESFHSFQVYTQGHASSSSSSIVSHGTTYPAHAEGEASYPSLPPLSVPPQAASFSGEGKAGSKRIVMACHQCRGRKIRCDAARPACSNCVRRREECRYDAKPKRRGPDKVPGSRMRSCKSRKQASDEVS